MFRLAVLFAILFNVYECKPNPVLLVSFDGFRADKLDDFLTKNPNSNFNKFIKGGVRAQYMKPSFPSLTFPNHWTLVTGQYVESHGIVANVIYFPEYNIKVRMGATKETQFWNRSEPFWLTAKNQGKKTAASFWVGSETFKRQPDIFLNFGDKFELRDRVDMLVSWFKKFNLDFACMYFDQPDADGHSYGPDAPQYEKRIEELDNLFGYLITRLEEENLRNNMNIIVVSDHGMAKLADDFQIPINQYIDMSMIELDKIYFASVTNIFPKKKEDIDALIENMSKIPNLKVYKRDEVPIDFHYSKSDLIAPIVAIANEGYELVEKKEAITYLKAGAHGWNNSLLSMRAIFLANGPSFESNVVLDPFQNINVYSLLCKLVDIKCNPSNGTIEVFSKGLKSSASRLFSFNYLIFSIIFALELLF